MRGAITLFLSLVLRIFFRRVDVKGEENLPRSGPAIVVLNHPNGLLDPLLVLCRSPRSVSFLAKAPLFRMPVVGFLVRALDSIPVYRKQDDAEKPDPAKTRLTFERARAVLAKGGLIALFPEGTTHSDPRMRPLKTGAARIALGAAAACGEVLAIVPAGLTFTEKATFRSSALVFFGTPFRVEARPLGTDGEPLAEDVRAVTQAIDAALANVTLQADAHEALELVERAERIFSADDGPPERRLKDAFETRRRFLLGYAQARLERPQELAKLIARIARHEAALKDAGLDPVTGTPGRPLGALLLALRSLGLLIALAPAALFGAALHYPAYRLTGLVARSAVKGDLSILATAKVLTAMLLYPLTWALLTTAAALKLGSFWAAAVAILTPLSGLASVLFFERLDELLGAARALLYLAFRKRRFLRLAAEREAIRRATLAIGRDVGLVS